MARPLRIHIPGALYHVVSRGNARQQIFFDADDYQHFLDRLAATATRFRVRCHAHCVLYNHFHLLLQPAQIPLSRMMQQLNSSYSQRFNRRHERVGHVLQGRFKGLLIDRDTYFRRVLRYIALNPVRAGLVTHPVDWPWSSYGATAGLVDPPLFLALDDVWDMFDPTDRTSAQQRYVQFVEMGIAGADDRPTGPVVHGSGQLAARVRMVSMGQRRERDIARAERFAIRPTLARLFEDATDRASRDLAMWTAFEQHGYTLREIGVFIGRHPTSVLLRIRAAQCLTIRKVDSRSKFKI